MKMLSRRSAMLLAVAMAGAGLAPAQAQRKTIRPARSR